VLAPEERLPNSRQRNLASRGGNRGRPLRRVGGFCMSTGWTSKMSRCCGKSTEYNYWRSSAGWDGERGASHRHPNREN
jgi:hypothetical protein